jgi:hypothetical protein
MLFRFSLGILVDVLNYEMKNYWLSRQEEREFDEAAYYLCSGYDIWSEVWYLRQMKQAITSIIQLATIQLSASFKSNACLI